MAERKSRAAAGLQKHCVRSIPTENAEQAGETGPRARPAYWRQPRKGTNLCVGLRLGPRRSRSALQLALSHQHTCFLQILLIHLLLNRNSSEAHPQPALCPRDTSTGEEAPHWHSGQDDNLKWAHGARARQAVCGATEAGPRADLQINRIYDIGLQILSCEGPLTRGDAPGAPIPDGFPG